MYSSCASSTCIFASLDRARVAKMSRISSARSITRLPVASSTFFPCAGESSSSKTIERRFGFLDALRQLLDLPFAEVGARDAGDRSAASAADDVPPAVSASSASSSRCSVIF